jgi:hypothetical protein
MGNGSGVSRGDRLRMLVPSVSAIVGIDLADKKQMVVVTDHDSKVVARRTFRCRAWDLGASLDWASKQAAAKGFAGVTVACELTGHRWRVLGQLAGERGMPFVCVQPMLTSWARRSEDLTFDKTDEKDAVIIARLTAQLRRLVLRQTPRLRREHPSDHAPRRATDLDLRGDARAPARPDLRPGAGHHRRALLGRVNPAPADPGRLRLRRRRPGHPHPVQATADSHHLAVGNRTHNTILRSMRCLGERGFAILTGRWRTLRHATASPRSLGDIVRAALHLTHFEYRYLPHPC